MPNNIIYPPFSQLLPKVDLTIEITAINNFVENIFNNLHYKDALLNRSLNGDRGFYKFTLVSKKAIGYEIPGTGGLRLLLNPGFVEENNSTSEFPISFSYQLEILKYINGFKLQNFQADPKAYFDLLLEILGLSTSEMLKEAIDVFIGGEDPVQEFVQNYNQIRGSVSNITYDSGLDENPYIDLIYQIDNSGYDIIEVVFEDYVLNTNLDDFFENIKNLFKKWFGNIDFAEIFKTLFVPDYRVSLDEISLGLAFPQSIVRPVNPATPEQQTVLTFDVGSLSFDSNHGFVFNNIGTFNFPESYLLGTEFTLSVIGMKLDLSRNSSIPEAIADNRPNDFVGAYITEAAIGFPAFWNHNDSSSTAKLVGKNLLIGTGGISGTIGMEAISEGIPSPLIQANFGGGFNVSLDAFFIRFQQNAIIESTIHGSMQIPGFKDSTGADAHINIDAWIGTNGEFAVTASEDQGITALKIPGVLDVRVDSLTVGRQNERFYVAVAGAINFVAQEGFLGQFIPDAIEVQKLLIWQDGQIEFEGGGLVLPRAITMKLGPVHLAITAIGFGAHQQVHNGVERKYKFFEFSGGVKVSPGGVEARGDGVKFYYTVDNSDELPPHRFVRIQGIKIDLYIPSDASATNAAIILNGYLAMKDPAPGNEAAGTEYAGGIMFTLPRLEMGGSASMRINPKVPAFIVDIGIELKSPLLLGSTGLGIYGFRALVGGRYVATKTAAGVPEDGAWWQYYKAKIAPDYKEGIQSSKFSQTPGFSLGAGVSLATALDSGRVFSTKLFFMLSLPEVFLFQGQGQFLKERVGLDTTTDPPFFAMIAISRHSVEAGFGVNYSIPDDSEEIGRFARIDGLAEMGFFFGNSAAWYINIGKDEPDERRINVRLFQLFDTYFYLMLSSSGIRAGAGAKFEFEKKFGPLRAELGAYLDIAGRIAFKPKQYGASIQLGGKVGLYIFKFGFAISVDAALAAEAPRPFIVTGSLKVCIEVIKKKYCAEFEFTWVKDEELNLDENLILERSKAAKAVHILTAETFDLLNTDEPLAALDPTDLDAFIVPVDSFIDIEFLKGVKPSASVNNLIGGNTQAIDFVEFVSPQKAKHSRVLHEYNLNQVNIYTWNGTAWVNYDIYAAATPLSAAPFVTADLGNLKQGYWQHQKPNVHNKLRILAQTPLSYMSQGLGAGGITPAPIEEFGFTAGSFFCPPTPIGLTCINFQHLGTHPQHGGRQKTLIGQQVYQQDKMFYSIEEQDGTIIYAPHSGIYNAIKISGNQTLNIVFTESMAQTSLIIKSQSDAVLVHFYKNVNTGIGENNMPQFEYTLVESRSVNQVQLLNPIVYDDLSEPIDKIVIVNGACTASTVPLVCDSVVTDEAKALQRFLNVQSQLGHLTTNNQLYPQLHAQYDGIYQNSPLYLGVPSTDPLSKTISLMNNFNLQFNISDRKITCNFQLMSVNSLVWTQIASFRNIRPLQPTVAGANYSFEIDAVMQNGTVHRLRGSSCHNIINCHRVCSTNFYQLCYITYADALSNSTAPSFEQVEAETNALIEAVNGSIQPVWRPNSYFAIEIQTQEKLFENATESPLLANYSNNQIFAFKTVGPTGFYHQSNDKYNDLVDKDREMEFKLSGLQHYIDYNKSYPNANGALINAKPLFYDNPQLNMYYLKPYVFEFYKNWDAYQNNDAIELNLKASILDPAPEEPNAPITPIVAEWLVNSLPGISIETNVLNNLMSNGNPCVPTQPLSPMGAHSRISCGALKPLKLYTALFTAHHKPAPNADTEKEEVHRYVFQTSQYADFEEQVNSYILETDENDNNNILKRAVFNLTINDVDAPMITEALAVINDSLVPTDSLRLNFANPMDRLLDGVFKIGALHPAMTTEFNILKDENENILGVLVRNPEPFNDPKIPLTEILDTIEASVNSTYLDKKVYSSDNRSVFLTNSDMNLSAGTGNFEFAYKQWQGNAYGVLANVSVEFEIN
jgi:hypothetical protein